VQALQAKVAVQDQQIAAEMEELAQIEGPEDRFTFHAFEVDEPVDGPPPCAATRPVALVTSYLKQILAEDGAEQ
jgi:hypothetical protein